MSDRQYVAVPDWMSPVKPDDAKRYWEASETTRLNSAHWTHANGDSINTWLVSQLTTLRQRAIYETRQNGILAGMQNTHADDIWGQDGPLLQVQSENADYNAALESIWHEWFAAPTPRPNISGASMGRLWLKNIWRCGEYIARIITLPDASGPVKMRLHPVHPRRLSTPTELSGRDDVVMGIRFDQYGRPATYYIDDQTGMGVGNFATQSTPWPADLIVHEFILDEEDQVRGVPLHATGLQPAADLRDYDDQVQDAARSVADQAAFLFTEHPDAPFYDMPEGSEIERRTVRMAPPGWKPFVYPATQPAVQYPDYRAERQIELGRPASMPRLMVRLDASKHSWASARLDMTTYRRATQCLQAWFSGSDKATGTLNRLVNEVEREARLSIFELRRRPEQVRYHWTWPQIDDVEPAKTAQANQISLTTGDRTLTEILASRKKTVEQHVEELRREREIYEAAGIPLPGSVNEPPAMAEDEPEPQDEPQAEGADDE